MLLTGAPTLLQFEGVDLPEGTGALGTAANVAEWIANNALDMASAPFSLVEVAMTGRELLPYSWRLFGVLKITPWAPMLFGGWSSTWRGITDKVLEFKNNKIGNNNEIYTVFCNNDILNRNEPEYGVEYISSNMEIKTHKNSLGLSVLDSVNRVSNKYHQTTKLEDLTKALDNIINQNAKTTSKEQDINTESGIIKLDSSYNIDTLEIIVKDKSGNIIEKYTKDDTIGGTKIVSTDADNNIYIAIKEIPNLEQVQIAINIEKN